MKRMICFFLATAVFISFSALSQAGEVLDRIHKKKLLVVATAPNWPPQAFLNDENEMDGFDVDVAKEIARRLGAKVKFVTPVLDLVVSGRWNHRWDLNVSSLTPTKERAKVLSFPGIYHYTLAKFAVHRDSQVTSKSNLNGKIIGVNIASTHERYLTKNLVIDAEDVPKFTFDVTPGSIKTYDTETFALDDLRLGDGVRLDAVLASKVTLVNAQKSGYPIRILGDYVFAEPLSITVDKGDLEFENRLSTIIDEMKSDGTLKKFSLKWYGTDTTTAQ